MTTITAQDLREALAHHVDTLERAGITFDGRLELTTGSKTYGNAFRLYRTGHMVTDSDGRRRATTGHANPPVGSDFIGWTKREAYETLTARTRIIADTVYALEQCGRL